MSDTLSEEQMEFNDFLVIEANYKRFKAYEFKDLKVKRLFDMYFFRLKNEEFSIVSFKKELEEYFNERYVNNPSDAYNSILAIDKGQRKNLGIAELFKINSLSLAMSIGCPEYYAFPTSRYTHNKLRFREQEYRLKKQRREDYSAYRELKNTTKEDRLLKEEKALNRKVLKQNIEEWHLYCIAINQAEQFIKEKYKGWGSELSKAERRKVNKKLEVISEQLKIFDNNIFNSMALHDIANTTKYTFNSLKTAKLLSYNLPQIDTQAKAKAITEDLLPPYN